MTARAYLPDEKIGLPPNAAVLSRFQMFFVRKTLQRTPSTGEAPLNLFARIFNGWQSLLAAVTVTPFDSRGSRPSGPLRRFIGKIHAGLGPFEPKGPILPMGLCFCGKTRILRPIFSLLIETIGSQVVVSMFTCSSRPPSFDLPGCHARVDLPECQ